MTLAHHYLVRILLRAFMLLLPLALRAQPAESGSGIAVEWLPGAVNTLGQEYGPMITPDGTTLYFVSDRSGGEGGHDIWVASRQADGRFSAVRNLGSPINSSGSEGAMAITADGAIAYFVGCNRVDGKGDCDIYRARLEAGAWVDVRNVAELNSSFWESQPAISSDGKTIYFVSNRSGDDNVDIYVAHMGDEGIWSAPARLGDSVNSSAQEGAPFIAPGNVLYFASDRAGGFGGYDLYASRLRGDGAWGASRNLGAPLNTASDERFVTLPASTDVLYFASNRPRGSRTDLDIFRAKLTQVPATILVRGKVYGRHDGLPIGTTLKFIDHSTGDTIATTVSDRQTGLYSMTLTGGPAMAILAFANDPVYYGSTTMIDLPATDEYREVRHDIVLDKFVGTGVDEERAGGSAALTIHPNPATGWVTIECPAVRRGTVTVSDLYGARRGSAELVDGRCTLDVTGFPVGIYLVRVEGKVVRFIVQR